MQKDRVPLTVGGKAVDLGKCCFLFVTEGMLHALCIGACRLRQIAILPFCAARDQPLFPKCIGLRLRAAHLT